MRTVRVLFDTAAAHCDWCFVHRVQIFLLTYLLTSCRLYCLVCVYACTFCYTC